MVKSSNQKVCVSVGGEGQTKGSGLCEEVSSKLTALSMLTRLSKKAADYL